jgi:hypothetical protein
MKTLRVYGPEMYLEMARAFARTKIALTELEFNLQSSNDLPIATQMNLQFVMTAVTAVFSVSFLEGYVNLWFDQLLNNGIDLSSMRYNQQKTDFVLENVERLQVKYCAEGKRDNLFRREKLTEKIKELYRVFDAIPPYESSDAAVRRLWDQLIDLQNLRNDLIHLKPEFLRSPRLLDMLGLDGKGREDLVNVPTVIAHLMTEQLPIANVNLAENVLISEAVLIYANKHPLEEFLLGREYSAEEAQHFMTRQPHQRRQ